MKFSFSLSSNMRGYVVVVAVALALGLLAVSASPIAKAQDEAVERENGISELARRLLEHNTEKESRKELIDEFMEERKLQLENSLVDDIKEVELYIDEKRRLKRMFCFFCGKLSKCDSMDEDEIDMMEEECKKIKDNNKDKSKENNKDKNKNKNNKNKNPSTSTTTTTSTEPPVDMP